MPIEPWKSVLRWNSIPNFISIHKLTSTERFLKLYHSDDPRLAAFFTDLMEGLEGTDPEPAVRIESPPGWGKTSCFYYLHENKKLAEKFYYSIIDASRLIGSEGLDRAAAFDECRESVYGYLHDFAPDKNFAQDILANDNLTNLQKLTAFLRAIEKRETGIKQRLVVVLDNVDIIQEEKDVLGAVLEIFRFLRPPDIVKWLAMRKITYDNYSRETREALDTHFSTSYDFPNVSLSAIVKLRIQEAGDPEKVINPFSNRLCDVIQKLYDGDHRKGLGTLKELLQTVSPEGLRKKATEKSIQRHLENMSLSTLIKRQAIPNIFSIHGNVNTLLPIPLEVMQLANFRRIIDSRFIELIEESLSSKYNKISKGEHLDARIELKDILDAAEYLDRLGLIEFVEQKNINLTIRGRFTQRYLAHQKHYVSLCKAKLEGQAENKVFWKIAEAITPYRAILMDEIFSPSDEKKPLNK